MQVSTVESLTAGVYDGHMSLQALRQYGDMGLGTYDHLDGEMVLLDGAFYKIRYDGTVVSPPMSELTPFAAVTHFVADHEASVAGVDMAGLEAAIDALVPQANVSVAFLVRGTFAHVRTRSVPAQEEPYPPLAAVTKNQAVFDLENVDGTVVGFRLPGYVERVNVTGYHLHFLTHDGSAGGHVLELSLSEGTMQLDTQHDWLSIYTPTENAAFAEGISPGAE